MSKLQNPINLNPGLCLFLRRIRRREKRGKQRNVVHSDLLRFDKWGGDPLPWQRWEHLYFIGFEIRKAKLNEKPHYKPAVMNWTSDLTMFSAVFWIVCSFFASPIVMRLSASRRSAFRTLYNRIIDPKVNSHSDRVIIRLTVRLSGK